MPRPTQPTSDPLADLRDAAATPPPAAPEDVEAPADPQPTHGQGWHDDATAVVVAAWHADPTSNRFVHHGGNCGCRYLARQALQAVHGAPVDPQEGADPTEKPDE